MLAALDVDRGRDGARGRSRSSQTDEDIHTAVERRVTELAGAAGAKLHTGAQPQRPGRHRPAAVVQARAGRRSASGVVALQQVLLARRRGRPATSTCPATPTCSAPSRSCWPTTCSPTAGPSARDVDRLLATIERLDVSPLGAGALAGTSLPIDPALHGAGARLRPARSTTRSTRSAIVTSSPRRCSTSPCSGCTSRASARSGCCGRRRSSASPASPTPMRRAPRCCRRRRTPTSPSWRGARRGGSSGTSPACWPRSRGSRSPTTATSKRTRSRCSTRCARCRWPSPPSAG